MEWLICRLYLLAEHYSSVQKKTAMQKKMFRKSYEHFSDEHFWDFPKIHTGVFTTNDVHTFGISTYSDLLYDFQYTVIPYMDIYRDSLRIASIVGFPIGIY